MVSCFYHITRSSTDNDVTASEKDRQYLKRDILENRDKVDVVITTYDIATKKADCSFLAKLKPNVS